MISATRPTDGRMPLNDRIDALNRDTAEASPVKLVFETVTHILALARVRTVVPRLPVDSRSHR